MIICALLPGSPPELVADAVSLSELCPNLQEQQSGQITERCPACRTEIPFQEITSAKCANGHVWCKHLSLFLNYHLLHFVIMTARCTVTTFLLTTPLVRTCIGCGRKTFLPISSGDDEKAPNWLPSGARGWVVVELMEAVNRCLYCGNSFVSYQSR